jgi:hypothetical protein
MRYIELEVRFSSQTKTHPSKLWKALAHCIGLQHLKLIARIEGIHCLDARVEASLTNLQECDGLRALTVSRSFELEIKTSCCEYTVYRDGKLPNGHFLASQRLVIFEERYKKCEDELRKALLKG